MSQNVSQTRSDRGQFFDTLKKLNNELQDEIHRQENAVKKLEQEILELRFGMSTLNEEKRTLQQKLNNQDLEICLKTKEIENLQADARLIQQKAEENMNTLKTQNDRIAQENNRLSDLLKQFESENMCIPILQKEIDVIKKKMLSAEEAHTMAMAKTNKEWNSHVYRVKAEKENAVKKLDRDIQELKNETSTLKNQKAELQKKLNEKENAIHAKTKETENFVASVKLMKEQYDAREKDLCERIKNMSDGKSQVERLVMEKQRCIEHMQATLQDHVSTINNHVSTIHSLEKDKTDLTLRKAELQKELKEKEKAIHAKTKETENFVASVKVMKEEYDAREKEFCKRIKNLSDGKSQAERLVMEKQRCIEHMQATLQNHVSTINNHVSTIHSLEKYKKDLTLRLSKLADTDLSDENCPTKFAEKFSELYDNEWTDAFEAVLIENEKDKAQLMLHILKSASQLCHDTSRHHMDAIKSSLSTLVIRDLWTKEQKREPVRENWSDSKNTENRAKDDNAKYQTERKMVKMTGRSKPDTKRVARDVAPDSDDIKNGKDLCTDGERSNTSGNEMIKTPDANDNRDKHSPITGSTKCCSVNGKKASDPLTLSADFDQLASEQKKKVLEIRDYFGNHLSEQFYKVGSSIIEKEMGLDQHAHARESIVKYIEKCMKICWSMCSREPPVHIEFLETEGEQSYDTNMFKPYTRTGKHLDFVVWPALYLYENGPMLAKGVAQGRK